MPEGGWAAIAAICVVAVVFLTVAMVYDDGEEATWFPHSLGLAFFGLGVHAVLKTFL